MNKPYIVFTGTQSVGKTTLIKPLIPIIEKMYGESVVHIAEVARSLERRGFKINKEATTATQQMIEEEYLRLEQENPLAVKVADRSIIDRFSYTLLNSDNGIDKLTLLKWYNDNIEEHCKKYSHIFHIPLTDEVKLELDGIRSPDEEYRRRIDEIQTKIINQYKIKVHTLAGTVEERLEVIKKVLESTNGISLRSPNQTSVDAR
jgi:nicotinamide riboside kinase